MIAQPQELLPVSHSPIVNCWSLLIFMPAAPTAHSLVHFLNGRGLIRERDWRTMSKHLGHKALPYFPAKLGYCCNFFILFVRFLGNEDASALTGQKQSNGKEWCALMLHKYFKYFLNCFVTYYVHKYVNDTVRSKCAVNSQHVSRRNVWKLAAPNANTCFE